MPRLREGDQLLRSWLMGFLMVGPGYASFDGYNGFNNYSFGNGMFDERMRGDRGGRGKVQSSYSEGLMYES